MNLRLIAVLICASALPLTAQQTGGDQELELVRPPTGGTFIQWEAKAGRTYFIQVSDPAEPLRKWSFAPFIELGSGQTISYEVTSTADRGFFRLKYTDVPVPYGIDPDDADPDEDGKTSAVEVLGGTDPLDPDTDDDGLPDGWELDHGLVPTDDGSGNIDNGADGDPDHDGIPNSEEWDAGTDPSQKDSDGDGITDGGELDQGTDPNDPADKPEAEWFVLTGDSPQGVAKARSRTVTIPKGESRLVVVMLASEEYPEFTGYASNFNDVLAWNVAGSGLAINGTVDVNSRNAAWDADLQNEISCLGFSPAHLEDYHSVQAPPDSDLDVTMALSATNVADGIYPSTVMVGLLPIEFHIAHTENQRDAEGNELASTVNPGENTLLRDEIADLRITLPSMDKSNWSLTIDLEPNGMKMATLGSRGAVQMYDIGRIEEGTVVPLTATANGATIAGPYEITLSGDETVTDAFRVVANNAGAFRLRMKTADGKIDVAS